MTSYSVYSTDYDPGCQLCHQGQHSTQTHTSQQKQVSYQSQPIQQNFAKTTQYVSQTQFPVQQVNQSYTTSRMVTPQETLYLQNLQLSPNKQYTQNTTNLVHQQVVMTPPKQVTYTQSQPQFTQISNIQQVEQRPLMQQFTQRNLSNLQNVQTNTQNTNGQYSQTYNKNESTQSGQSSSQMSQITHVHNVEHMPLVHEIHHIERPVQVIGIEEVELPWRAKVTILEKQLIELELLVKRGGNRQTTTQEVVVEDINKIKKLQQQHDDIERFIRDKEEAIMEAQAEIERLTLELEHSTNSVEVQTITNEIDVWKKKFVELNRKYHNDQEMIMLKQAELDSLKNKKVIVQQVRSGNPRESNSKY